MTNKLLEVKLAETEITFLLAVMEQVPVKGSGTMKEFLALKKKLEAARPKKEAKKKAARAKEDA